MSYTERPTPFIKKHTNTFFRIGMVIALTVVIAAFHWPVYYTPPADWTISEPVLEPTFSVTIVEPAPPKEERKQQPKIITPPKVMNIIPVNKPVIIPKPTPPVIDPPKTNTFKIKKPAEEKPAAPTSHPEKMPEFPGGDRALFTFLARTKYCDMAKENDIQGTVYVQWVVGIDGKVRDITIPRSVFPCLDEAVIQQINNMPQWTPGLQGNSPVPVIMVAPIRFSLD